MEISSFEEESEAKIVECKTCKTKRNVFLALQCPICRESEAAAEAKKEKFRNYMREYMRKRKKLGKA